MGFELTPKKRKTSTTSRGSRTPRGAHRQRGTSRTQVQERNRLLQEELSEQVVALHTPHLATTPKKRGRPPGKAPPFLSLHNCVTSTDCHIV